MFLKVGGGGVMRLVWLVGGGLEVIASGVRGFRWVVGWRLEIGGGYKLVDGGDGGGS